jgi:hypothetical protein
MGRNAIALAAVRRKCDMCDKAILGFQAWHSPALHKEGEPFQRKCKECYADGNPKLLDALTKIEATAAAWLSSSTSKEKVVSDAN